MSIMMIIIMNDDDDDDKYDDVCDLKSFWTKPTAWFKSSPTACPAVVAH